MTEPEVHFAFSAPQVRTIRPAGLIYTVPFTPRNGKTPKHCQGGRIYHAGVFSPPVTLQHRIPTVLAMEPHRGGHCADLLQHQWQGAILMQFV